MWTHTNSLVSTVHLNKDLDWRNNTEAVYKKGQSRLYLLRRLKSFNVCSKLLVMFYQSIVASVLFYAVVCWGGAEWGLRMESVQSVAERRIRDKLKAMLANTSHPLYGTLQDRTSTFSRRLTLPPRMNSERYRLSFIPTAIRLFNANA